MAHITDSTPVYLYWANKAAASGGTLTIFNDSGGGGGFAGRRKAGRKLQGKFRGGG